MSYAFTGWAIAAAVGYGVYSASEANTNKKTANSANLDAERAAKAQQTAAQAKLTKDEAGRSASKKMFREGLYFTSPGGTLGSGNRGSSRLMGS